MLSRSELGQFYDLHTALMLHAGIAMGVVRRGETPVEWHARAPEQRFEVRQYLLERPELFGEFVATQPSLTAQDAADVMAWRDHHVLGRFIVLKLTKCDGIFLATNEPSRAYLVAPLGSPFLEIFGEGALPTFADTLLIPFRDQIVSDGLYNTFRISMGATMRKGLLANFAEVKAKGMFFMSLPARSALHSSISDADLLKTYLKSEASRRQFANQIHALSRKSRELATILHQEQGRFMAKRAARQFKNLGFNDLWIAQLDDLTIASAKTEQGLRKVLEQTVPDHLREFVYLHHLK